MIKVKNVTKVFNETNKAVDNISFEVNPGEIVGFIGPNGSGKTTTIQMMMDILQIDSGDITLFGTPHNEHRAKQKIGFVYDDLYMYDEFNINKIIMNIRLIT